MGFYDETKKLLGINKQEFEAPLLSTSPQSGTIIEGYKKILELSDTKIIILCSNNKNLEIIGLNLCIKEMARNEITIKGKITTINFL